MKPSSYVINERVSGSVLVKAAKLLAHFSFKGT